MIIEFVYLFDNFFIEPDEILSNELFKDRVPEVPLITLVFLGFCTVFNAIIIVACIRGLS